MPAHKAAVQWNDKWWEETVRGRKDALPTLRYTKEETEPIAAEGANPMADIDMIDGNDVLPPPFKPAEADELRHARQVLDKITKLARKFSATIDNEFDSADDIDDIRTNVRASVYLFCKEVLGLTRSTL